MPVSYNWSFGLAVSFCPRVLSEAIPLGIIGADNHRGAVGWGGRGGGTWFSVRKKGTLLNGVSILSLRGLL